MRLGLLGGTFDPPHVGHLLAAVDAFEALALDRLLFIPAAQQPLKVGQHGAPAADRLAMVELMVADDARFAVDPIEINRPGLSFTVDTLATFRARPEVDELFFLMGADVLGSFHLWKDAARVQELAELVILRRGDDVVKLPPGVRARTLRTRLVDVSSSEIRMRLAAGRSIRGFVSASVEAYVKEAGLYSQRNNA